MISNEDIINNIEYIRGYLDEAVDELEGEDVDLEEVTFKLDEAKNECEANINAIEERTAEGEA